MDCEQRQLGTEKVTGIGDADCMPCAQSLEWTVDMFFVLFPFHFVARHTVQYINLS